MKSGVNRLQGRNSNYMDLNPDGSTIISSGNTSIQINTDNVSTAPVVTPSTPSTIIVPNLNKTTGSFETITDIIPITSSTSIKNQIELNIEPTSSLTYEQIFAIEVPDEEETFFSLYDSIDITSIQVFDSLDEIKTYTEDNQIIETVSTSKSLKTSSGFKNLRESVKKLDLAFYNKVVETAKKLGNENLVDALLATMKHESGFSTSISAPKNVTRGLIQFFFGKAKTIKIGNKGPFTREDLAKQTRVQQMDLVYEFYRYWFKALNISNPKLVDIYIVTFFPAAVGKPDSYVLKTKRLSAETVADQNPAFNRILQRPKKEPLTIAKLKKYYQIQGFPI